MQQLERDPALMSGVLLSGATKGSDFSTDGMMDCIQEIPGYIPGMTKGRFQVLMSESLLG